MSYFFAWWGGLWLAFFGGILLKATVQQNLQSLLRYRFQKPGEMLLGEKIYFRGHYSVGKSLLSPLTKTPCLRWRITVTEARGKKSNLILDQASQTPFFVTDQQQIFEVLPRRQNSTRAIAIGKSRAVLPSPQQELDNYVGIGKWHYQAQQHLFQPLKDPQAIAFLENHQINPTGPLGSRRALILLEYVWEAGDPIYIFGKLIRRDRQQKLLIPWVVTHRPRWFVFAVFGGLGLLGCALFGAGIVVILNGGLPR